MLRMPKDQGLYESRREHDACGVGAVVKIDGTPSRRIIELGNQIVMNLQHRGAAGADESTGDGAGILFQIPHDFFAVETSKLGITLPADGTYGVGMIFAPKSDDLRKQCDDILAKSLTKYSLAIIGWRDVPGDNSCLGELARQAEPVIRQVFVDGKGLKGDKLENRLFLARKHAESRISKIQNPEAEDYYVVSLSCKTICYKGMFLSPQLFGYYPDLSAPNMVSALAVVHQRYSTNTFPSWKLAQPFRYVAHNGEINTLSGNANRMKARERRLHSESLGGELKDILPILTPGSSDSAQFDNVLELLTRGGRSLPHSVMMMIPEAFGPRYHMSTDKRSFYEYHSTIMEPWDGPAAMIFTDGRLVGGTLDRNGLRPARYVVTTGGLVVLASEAGVIDFEPEKVREKGRLQPGRMFLVDTEEARIVRDNEIKGRIARQKPYRRWVTENRIELRGLSSTSKSTPSQPEHLRKAQRLFGYTREEFNMVLSPMGINGQEPVGSMGTDTPLAVLSNRPKLLSDYFKQMFAQVTNPPIDPLREGLVMSLMTYVGKHRNLLAETPEHCRQLKLPHPVLTNDDMVRLREMHRGDFKIVTVDTLFDVDKQAPADALKRGIGEMITACRSEIENGASLLILSDKNFSMVKAPIPAVLAVSALHHAMLDYNIRGEAGIVIESGEARTVMDFCLLCGFGANAINPYMALETLEDLRQSDDIPSGMEPEQVVDNYIAAIKKGILKTMSKMGISTLRSYRSAQLFEAIGINREVIDAYFTGTSSRIEGVSLEQIAIDTYKRHESAFSKPRLGQLDLEFGGEFHYRCDGEHHLLTPQAVAYLHQAVRSGSFETFKKYSSIINDQSRNISTLRGLFEFRDFDPIDISQVEPASEIVKRFVTGAMSHGSISKEAHEAMAIAMNRLGAMSNTGEGGEDPIRYQRLENGDSLNSAIKQVASGRFGVTMEYLSHAGMIQIKMAQGAKPGEGGQLPGHKVTDEIARLRYSTPGVTLISPPPHHDIYSIEDLAQLIYDLKCSNPGVKVSVKLVSEVGVGTIAAGVAKGNADEVLISGHDGGTGASPLSSIKHAGIPWELGLAETQQTLVLNGLRDRIRVQTDGQLKTGRDVAIAALLGAESFGFATTALISLGCIMMRKCHLGTCPVGVATQDPELRKRFRGKPEHLQNFMLFVAEEVRDIMAQLGFKTIDDMVGHVEKLQCQRAIEHYKGKGLDFSGIFRQPDTSNESPLRQVRIQSNPLKTHLDWEILKKVQKSIDTGEKTQLEMPIRNIHRTVGTILSNHIVKKHGQKGLPDGTIELTFRGSAGQSFGAFLTGGIMLKLIGESNDYLGKGMSGGRIIVQTPFESQIVPHENIIVGNVLLYGATGGEVFVNGLAGERFAVRNSGATAVVEGVGDHGCEYMTNGLVVVLGQTGRNFAAGMSGGIAYVLDEHQLFDTNCNLDMVDLEPVWQTEDIDLLYELISKHHKLTASPRAGQILSRWRDMVGRFVKVIPIDYRRALQRLKERESRSTENTPATEEVFNG